MKDSFPASWYPLCRSAELASGQVIPCEAFGLRLAVFRTKTGKVGALQAECAHMGANLAQGRVVGERLRCPLHEWEYELGGRCEHIPGTADIPARARQAALRCEEHYGLVFAFLGGEPVFDFPLFEASDHHVYSRAYVMDFDTPYQVLAANSFDSQHFSTVHHRELLAPPTMMRESAHHFGVEFNARVHGDKFHDRFLRWAGVDIVELSAHCWGGNNILAYNARTHARILFTLLPRAEHRTRVFIVNVIASRTAPTAPRLVRRALLAGMHELTVAFLKPDIAVMRQLRFKLGVLLPDLDHGFIEWVKYWKALPRVSALTSDARR